MPTPLLYESHMHTPLCRHSIGEPEEYAAVALARNLAGITVTCHNPCPNGFSASARMREEQWPDYLALVDRARRAYAGRLDVRLGLECDFFPGLEPYVGKQIASAPLSHVLGSVHPQTSEYITAYAQHGPLQLQKTYFQHLADAAETKLFDTLSHPDLVKNQTRDDWNLDRIWPDILRALDRIARAGTAMELNTSGLNKTIPEMNPGPRILAAMAERKIPVVLGADAHEPVRVADRYPEALTLLESAGFTHVSFFIDRKRRDIPIPTARESLIF